MDIIMFHAFICNFNMNRIYKLLCSSVIYLYYNLCTHLYYSTRAMTAKGCVERVVGAAVAKWIVH